LFLAKTWACLKKCVAEINYYFGYLVSSAQEMARNPNTEKKIAPPTMMITHSRRPPCGTAL
jgi:hypothetical protein